MCKSYKFVSFVLFIFWIAACKPQDNEKLAINRLLRRFPQLKADGIADLTGYNLKRGIVLEQPNITIKLFCQPDSAYDKQAVILLTNSKADSYAIPLFSNTYQDYWQFPSTKPTENKYSVSTTFEKEINESLDYLSINDTIAMAGKVINEILYSLLHCQDITSSDSTNLLTTTLSFNNSAPEDKLDSCTKRFQQNWKTISQDMYPNKMIIYKKAYWDKQNGRIYQIDFTNFVRGKKNYFKIKSFRQDCNQTLLTL